MKFCEPAENCKKAEKLIADAAVNSPDVIVLPEMWNTGFFPQERLEDLADSNGENTKCIIGALAKKYNVNIVAGSVANVKDGCVYNTAYVFARSGECIAEYDKTHLFSPMNEDEAFKKGDRLCTFSLDGNRCGIIICYDVRFPELARSLALGGLDFLFVVAQWPSVRIPHLETLTRARAIENQMFVACCNSCGKAGNTVYGGHSAIIDPWGEVLCSAGGGEQIITADCDTAVLKGIRETINVFSDRRPGLYKSI